MKLLSVLTLLLLSLVQVHHSNSQSCSGVSPSQFLADPSTFRGVVTPLASQPQRQCRRESGGYNCLYSIILGDNAPVPSQPNLENSGGGNGDIGKFLVWHNRTDRPYVNFIFNSMQLLTGINIQFLNYPAQGFSLPNLELYSVTGPGIIDPNSPLAQRIEFELQNNNVLSQGDYQVTNVSLIFSNISQYFLLYWNYTGVYNLDFFMISEIDLFCNNNQPPGETQITFQDPQSDNSVIIPTVEELTVARYITINCTVSSSGLFEWQWRQNETVLSNNIRFSLFTADGTRTSILRIAGLNVSDAANYVCEVRRRSSGGGGEYVARTQVLSFSVIVDLPDQVTGYLGEGRVVLTCDVHGFLRSTNPPIIWLGRDGNPINSNTPKYSIDISDSSQTALLPDGTIVPGVRSTLTINQLEVGDEGSYTCMVDGNSALTQLTTVAGSAPPPTGSGGMSNNNSGSSSPESSSNQTGVIAGVVIGVILVIIITIVLVVLLIYIIRTRDIHCRLPRLKAVSIHVPTPKVNLEPLRRLSIRRSVRKENLESSASVSKAHQNGGSIEGSEGSPTKRRYTKADIEWQLPHVDNTTSEVEMGLIYSEVSKPSEKQGEEEAPPIPPQNFDPHEAMYYDNVEDESKMTVNNSHYENEGFAKAQRRLTNASSPRLAKKKVTASESEGLDTNPLYQCTEEAKESYNEGSNGTVEAPIYAEPNLPDRKSIESNISEPIYSEAIHPELFSQGPEAPQESTLTPVAPMYAEPHTLSLKRNQSPLKIPAFKIKELRPLGVGQFGEVMLAETVGLSLRDLKIDKTNNKRSIRIKVAVKKLRPQAGNQVRENFEKEINFMSKLKDDNIVRLLAVSKDDPPFIVMEYMENGDLHQFLQEYEPSYSDDILQVNQLPVSILLYMAVQIASGMRYLASLRYVHRDLATRNCLVGQNFVVKISDFGMSRSLYESSYYRVKGRAMLPIRWMASESFYGRFSEKTDVWSYGVTMWEIFTLAKHQPYEEIDDQEVIQDAIRGLGRRLLEKPKFCPMEVYQVMLRCWEYAPDDRANFEEVFNTLAAIHQSL